MDLNELNRQLIVAEEEIKLLKGGKKSICYQNKTSITSYKKTIRFNS